MDRPHRRSGWWSLRPTVGSAATAVMRVVISLCDQCAGDQKNGREQAKSMHGQVSQDIIGILCAVAKEMSWITRCVPASGNVVAGFLICI